MQLLGKLRLTSLNPLLVGGVMGGLRGFLVVGLILTLWLAAACGGAATGTPRPPGTPQPTAATALPTKGPTTVPLTTAAPAATPTSAAVKPAGKVTVMVGSFANEKFNPRHGGAEGEAYMHALHAWLIGGTENIEMVPGIATAWQVSQDGLTWNLTIRDGVKFHNGDEVTIQDVHFSLEHFYGKEAIEKALSVAKRGIAQKTDKIEITGPRTVSVTHRERQPFFAFLLSELSFATSNGVVPKKVFDQVGEGGYESNPIAAGPFKFVKYSPSEQILMERFGDYYQPERRATFETLDMRQVPEPSTRVASLRAGQADLVEASLAVKKQIEDAGGHMIFGRETSYTWVIYPGCWQPQFPCHDKRVRQALDYAVNKELIRDQLYGLDVATVKGWVHVTPSSLGYSPDLDPYPYDPAKAKQLLAEAGYPDGKGFPPITIHTWQAGDVPFMPELSTLIADFWKKNLSIQAQVSIGEAVSTRDRWFNRELDGDVIIRTNEARYDGGSIIDGGYNQLTNLGRRSEDPELAKVVAEAMSVLEEEKRPAAYNKAHKVLREAHYEWSPLYVNLPWGASSRIASWNPWPLTPYATALWTVTLK